jgi:FMN-binding domain.
MKISRRLTLILVFVLLIAIVAGCTQAPPKDQTKDQTENPTEDEKDAEVGEDKAENREENPPQEGEKEGPTTPEGVKDGTYEGKTDKDERGNYGVAKITVKNGKITEAEYTEYTEDGKPKSKENGYEYEEGLKAIEELPKQLLETQDIEKIDTYTGATGTTNKFKT